jgi:hypothetical protein
VKLAGLLFAVAEPDEFFFVFITFGLCSLILAEVHRNRPFLQKIVLF